MHFTQSSYAEFMFGFNSGRYLLRKQAEKPA